MLSSDIKFGRLSLIEEAPQRGYQRYFLCRCDCGVEKEVRLSHLKSGKILSCGCYKYDRSTYDRTGIEGRVSGTRLHRIYSAMKNRCRNENHTSYKNYGGKGVSVCDDWTNFKNFHDWALSAGYTDELSIDRIDSNKNYCPENCRWVTIGENVTRMLESHIENKTGAFSEESFRKMRETNKKRLGAKFKMFENGNLVQEFDCLVSAAEYIRNVRNIDTKIQSLKKNISACLNKKRNKCFGFTFEFIPSTSS